MVLIQSKLKKNITELMIVMMKQRKLLLKTIKCGATALTAKSIRSW